MRLLILALLASCAGAYWNDYMQQNTLQLDNLHDNRIQYKAVTNEIRDILLTQRATDDPIEFMALEQRFIDMVVLRDILKKDHFDLARNALKPL